MNRTLNAGQTAAAEAFFEFLRSDDPEFIISGPGGTGKTYLMGHLIDEVMPRYFADCRERGKPIAFDEVVMTATTNKAAEVLSVSTGRPVSTIHSFMNLKVQDDYATGQGKISPTNMWEVYSRKIIFIDECSLVDQQLRSYLHQGTIGCKLVYVGDHCQLAPITESISPIYRDGLPFYRLDEQMRTDNAQLQAVWQQLRDTVETGEFKPIPIIPGVIDLLDDEQMEAGLGDIFHDQTHGSRILAYTNKRVMEYNDHLRGVRELPAEYTVGEFLVNNSAYRTKHAALSVEQEVTVIAREDHPHAVDIEPGVPMMVRRLTLQTSIGSVIRNVPVAVDREHYAALVNYYRKQKNWNRYFHLKNTYPDLRPRDAATVYKAQGSTYDNVFIDLGNISTCPNPNQAARMLYVAFSRPRTRVFLYGMLSSKYGGLTI